MTNSKAGFIAIVGKPNVGKSSILNRLIGEKIAIVSSKPQTTRTRIMGVLTENETQLIFIDTPGLHEPRNNLDKYMLRSINESVAGVDACLLVVEAEGSISEEEKRLAEKFRALGLPAILAINKIDTVPDKTRLASRIADLAKLYDFDSVIPCSAQTGSGIDILKKELKDVAPEGEHMFDNDTLTDQPERVLAGEMIREKLLRLLSREVPHGTAVEIEKMRDRPDGSIMDIEATIHCEKESHKGIIIGRGGAMLKKIGSYAREDLEKFLETKINLKLWVKVTPDWRNKTGGLKRFGYVEEK